MSGLALKDALAWTKDLESLKTNKVDQFPGSVCGVGFQFSELSLRGWTFFVGVAWIGEIGSNRSIQLLRSVWGVNSKFPNSV